MTGRVGAADPEAARRNASLYRRWFEEVVNGRDAAGADELLAPDYVAHFPGVAGGLDRTGHLALLQAFWAGFPDWTETVEDVLVEGDRVVIRVTGRGRHAGSFQGIPPTGTAVTATGIGIARILDGRIVETWAEYDALGLLRQLGAVPSRPA
ncbi:ester cyclase [Geodermatophilus sp. YIM 151500]|uniref:ester cyclase n=1 Tax=Geodermatophilus sp. YIM 151500 TaxID=2984531 RepID=UPI0021E37165|nr:ester cyclase [Geodermatophilus sp. YIM 151500]MCV2491545.1 ester cyclase [Geodermatophilus sp. YIM 151500]